MENDAYYQMFSTPLKSASTVKAEHRNHLIEFFKMGSLRKELDKAPDLILSLMPNYVSPEDFNKIKVEFDRSGDHFVKFMESMSGQTEEKPILLQEMFGLSNETLLHVYDLGVELVKKGQYEDANTLFTFLTTMAPHVTSYWIAEGSCLQALSLYQEAIAVFGVAQIFKPQRSSPIGLHHRKLPYFRRK